MHKEKPNFDFLKQVAAGDIDFEEQIIKILKEEFPIEKELFYKTFFDNDFEAAAEVVNKINQKIGFLGMVNSQLLTVGFEEGLKNKNTQLFTDFDEILKDITTFIELL